MGRVAQEEIERLKREVSVQRLAEAMGVLLKRHGKDLMGLCPFHRDREPSLVITPSTNLWNCLGACRQGPRLREEALGPTAARSRRPAVPEPGRLASASSSSCHYVSCRRRLVRPALGGGRTGDGS